MKSVQTLITSEIDAIIINENVCVETMVEAEGHFEGKIDLRGEGNRAGSSRCMRHCAALLTSNI